MTKPSADAMLKALILDSLLARSGRNLDTEVIQEITNELWPRMIEVLEEEMLDFRMGKV